MASWKYPKSRDSFSGNTLMGCAYLVKPSLGDIFTGDGQQMVPHHEQDSVANSLTYRQAAALQPPHLSAIMVQDGWTCLYRELAWKGGVLHPNFMRALNDKWMAHANRVGTPVIDLSRASEHPYIDDFWCQFQPAVQNITCAIYAISSLADNGIHTPGTIRGYLGASSKIKYLELHPYVDPLPPTTIPPTKQKGNLPYSLILSYFCSLCRFGLLVFVSAFSPETRKRQYR